MESKNNYKLSAIEICAFRGFSDIVQFDFYIKDKKRAADFIAIYAPNGFGKTSFFDAVEWGINGDLRRFFDSNVLKQSIKEEGNYILRNNYAKYERSFVKFKSGNSNLFTRETNVKSKNDYKPGNILMDKSFMSKDDFDKYKKENRIEILPQSTIDSFLSSNTPEEKYIALVNLWNGYEETKYYVGIRKLLAEAEARIEELGKQIGDEDEKVLKNVSLEELILEINKDIEIFNIKENKGIRDLNVSGLILQIPMIKLENILNNNFDSHSISKNINILTEYLFSYQSLNSKLIIISNLYSEYLINLSERKNKTEVSQSLKNQQKYLILSRELFSLNSRIGECQNIKSRIDDYDKIIREISSLNLSNTDKYEKITKTTDEILNLEQEKNDFEKKLSELSLIKNQISEKTSLKDQTNNTLIKINENIKNTRNRCDQIERILKIREVVLQNLLNSQQQFESILSKPRNLILENDFFRENYNNHFLSIDTLNKELETKLNKNKALETEYNGVSDITVKLQKIVDLGKDYVETSKTDFCPLCKTKHNSNDHLIEIIRQQDNVNQKIISDLKNKIDLNNSNIGLIMNEIDSKFIDLFEKVSQDLNNIIKQHDNYKTKYDNTISLKRYFNGLFLDLNQKNKITSEKIDQLSLEIENLFLKQKGIGNITKVSDRLKFLVDEIHQKNNLKLIFNNEIEANKNRLQILDIDETFVRTNEFLIRSSLKIDTFSIKDIDRMLKDLELKKNVIQKDIELISDQDKTLSVEELSIINFELKIHENDVLISNLNMKISTYESSYFEIFENQNVSLKDIQKKIGQNDSLILSIEKTILLLKNIENQIGKIISLKNNLIDINKLDKLKLEKSKLDDLYINLTQLKKKTTDYLKSNIKRYINDDLINQ